MWTDVFKASKFAIFKNKIDKSSLEKKKIYAKKSGYLNVLNQGSYCRLHITIKIIA